MGAWGFLAHESDTGIDNMLDFMEYGKENGGVIQLADALQDMRKQGRLLPLGADTGQLVQTEYYRVQGHEYTVLALAEAVNAQCKNGSYSVYDFSMLPLFPILGAEIDQSEVEPTADERVTINFTSSDIDYLKGEVDRILNGAQGTTCLRFGWREPDEWLRQTTSTLERLSAIKPSILAQLQESKQAAAKKPAQEKTAPKHDKDMEV